MRGMWELRPGEEIRCIGSCSLSETLALRGLQAEEPAHCRWFFLFSDTCTHTPILESVYRKCRYHETPFCFVPGLIGIIFCHLCHHPALAPGLLLEFSIAGLLFWSLCASIHFWHQSQLKLLKVP